MMLNNMRKAKGIALIQVLLITAILSVLALFISQTAKQQVQVASWSEDKIQALVDMHSAEALVYHTLLTTKNFGQDAKQVTSVILNTAHDESPLAETENNERWNLFGRQFQLHNGVTVTIQDQAGKVHLRYPIRSVLIALIMSSGINEGEAQVIIDTLRDWQDVDNIANRYGNEQLAGIRNGSIPDISELKRLPGISKDLYEILSRNISIYRRGNFNPMNASAELISALTNTSAGHEVVELREQGVLTKQMFSQLTGIVESDDFYFNPSGIFEITLSKNYQGAGENKTTIIKVLPNASNSAPPINIYSVQ